MIIKSWKEWRSWLALQWSSPSVIQFSLLDGVHTQCFPKHNVTLKELAHGRLVGQGARSMPHPPYTIDDFLHGTLAEKFLGTRNGCYLQGTEMHKLQTEVVTVGSARRIFGDRVRTKMGWRSRISEPLGPWRFWKKWCAFMRWVACCVAIWLTCYSCLRVLRLLCSTSHRWQLVEKKIDSLSFGEMRHKPPSNNLTGISSCLIDSSIIIGFQSWKVCLESATAKSA